ncbi:hypothetical protein AVEN_109606-1 [Araneus ventricosus]|uniref:Uncharacterized protein n=1 Tax=Araneus ventricosus TaxID=182803 RepID=A0A4Y2P5P7_ARAVE|nr:hypothetical protein AVEN_109606-1 [Araneus ventricosus]
MRIMPSVVSEDVFCPIHLEEVSKNTQRFVGRRLDKAHFKILKAQKSTTEDAPVDLAGIPVKGAVLIFLIYSSRKLTVDCDVWLISWSSCSYTENSR